MAGMMQHTITAACIASMASFAAFPVISPSLISLIRALRPFSSFLSKTTFRRPVLLASDTRTTVRGSTSPLSVKMACLRRSINFLSGTGLSSGYIFREKSRKIVSSVALRIPRSHSCWATRCLRFFTPANRDTQV